MRPRNRPKSNAGSGLTPNGGNPAGERPGSAPKRIVQRPPGVSRARVRRFFAPGTPAAAAAPRGSACLPADVDELVATLGCPGRAGAGEPVELAAAAPAAGVDTEASSWPGTAAGPDVEPEARSAKGGRRCVGRQVDIQAVDVARANPSSPPPDGTAGHWR